MVLAPQLGAQAKHTVAQFLSPAYPTSLVSARKADRIAWVAYERGMRNVYTAAAPDFTPVRLTRFLTDEGVDIPGLALSDDGSTVVFVRGTSPNRQGWIANPARNADGGDYSTWTVKTSGGPAWRVASGDGWAPSPDGRYAIAAREGQIYRVSLTGGGAKSKMDTGGAPLIKVWGSNGNPQWSPDGSKIAFVSLRMNHSLIGMYDVKTRTVDYIAPSFDCDVSPIWFADGKRLFFSRRPGVPFGRQAQQGDGGIGFPAGAAAVPPATNTNARPIIDLESGCSGGRGGGFGRPAVAGGRGSAPNALLASPGLYSAAFAGGYTQSFMVADVATKQAREVWHNQPSDPLFATIGNMRLAGEHIVFPVNVPRDEWDRYYSVSLSATGNPAPVRLTTTDGLIEGTFISGDGQTFYYYTNATDIERRHVWSVPVSGGTPKQVTTGKDAETDPRMLPGKTLAYFSYGSSQPPSVAVKANESSTGRIIFPTLGPDFPKSAHVTPEIVITKAADGMEIHNQLFMPKGLRPGERRPALVFVHGGPPRQMLPTYHYMMAYTHMFAFNQYLADQGYVVLSINYRLGIGYGKSFQNAPGSFNAGNAEYQDVVAGARYLQARPDVDPTRVGIYGQSYGGLLTAQALARNSDIFVAGADLAGLHLYTNVLNDTSNVAYKSSPISAIDTWKSPVFLWQGDDDRNLDASQTIGLIPLLRARNIYFELMVVPDDMHEATLHSRMLEMYERTADFLHRFVWEKQAPPTIK